MLNELGNTEAKLAEKGCYRKHLLPDFPIAFAGEDIYNTDIISGTRVFFTEPQSTYFSLRGVGRSVSAEVVFTRVSSMSVWPSFIRREQESKIDILKDKIQYYIKCIEDIIDDMEQFEVSYNRTMMRGALRYCSNALKVLLARELPDESTVNRISSFVRKSRNLYQQHRKYPDNPFSRLDLQFFEDLFESIEEACHQIGLLPKLENLSL